MITKQMTTKRTTFKPTKRNLEGYEEYFKYIDSLTESERLANVKFLLRQKFNVSRGKAQKIIGEYYRSREK